MSSQSAARLANIQRCARCRSETYCNRECQKAHWKTHKKVCATNANANAAASGAAGGSTSNTASNNGTAKGLDVNIPNPFTRLDKGTWLHGRSERDVYKLLIDAYRLRADDMYNMEANVDEDSIMSGSVTTSIKPFKRFVTKIERNHRNLLPSWWNDEKREECYKVGLTRDGWEYLGFAIEKSDVSDHYDESRFPMQLRMFAESVYGSAPGGSSGAGMRQMMMMMEGGEMEGMHSFLGDVSGPMRRPR
ncbi:putative MYND domain protein [Phyllosticta capitalensis]